VTSISCGKDGFERLPTIHHDRLFIKNDLITFAKETRLKLYSSSTYIVTDAASHNMPPESYSTLSCGARILISFVGPTSHRLILRLKHSGKDGCLEVTLGSTIIQLNPSPKSSESLTIDDITLHPIQDVGPSESHHLSFEPGIRNEIFILCRRTGPLSPPVRLSLHDVELLDEDGLEYMPRTFN
jgi:hypothetical protein